MDLDAISGREFWGRFFLDSPGRPYFETLDRVRLLTEDPAWRTVATGYFFNASDRSGGIRLTYFSGPGPMAELVLRPTLPRFELEQVLQPEPMRLSPFTTTYGGSEVEFRRFLCAYSIAFSEAAASGLDEIRSLLARYRWQWKPAGINAEDRLSDSLGRLSPWFAAMSSVRKSWFFDCLDSWKGPGCPDWAHFPVQLLFAGDDDKVLRGLNPHIRLEHELRKELRYGLLPLELR